MFDFDEVFNRKSDQFFKHVVRATSVGELKKWNHKQLLEWYKGLDEAPVLLSLLIGLVKLILIIRDTVKRTNLMTPILNGLSLVEGYNTSLKGVDVKIDKREVPANRLNGHSQELLKFVSKLIGRVEISLPENLYYNKNLNEEEKRANRLVYFPRMPETFFLEQSTQSKFLSSFDHENPRYDLVKNMYLFTLEMSENKTLS